ncbi:hypothetical protein CEE39_10125 [bacterium (candidate division B38) B3_B38]|nr:MAG: hypothetical protein CEE39_10125 [bacterium (candidate division B38) B3_B38]
MGVLSSSPVKAQLKQHYLQVGKILTFLPISVNYHPSFSLENKILEPLAKLNEGAPQGRHFKI